VREKTVFMKLSVLSENCASPGYIAEHGLSYLIEHNDKKILFDTGASDVFLKNAKKMNIDLNDSDMIVLSHGHWDHGNGLKYIKDKTLLCHPGVFINRFHKGEKRNVGLNLSIEQIEERFSVIRSKEPYYISSDIIFLGEIPHTFEFEEKSTVYVDDTGNIDYIPDDSALLIIEDNELIIISGCAHSGICNITEYAKEITGIKDIKAVIGGFHLKKQSYQTRKTIIYFKDNPVRYLLPSHCTQLPAMSLFYENFRIKQVKSGNVYNF
jgi:7,8-dihydropterin-6-yl-methyl-4-(beta-D-ribofuranosyl)aminobenzene 5'-phosphate synthase